MARLIYIIFLVLAIAFTAAAQITEPKIRWVKELPSICSPSRASEALVYKYTATTGIYRCSAANTWSLLTDGFGQASSLKLYDPNSTPFLAGTNLLTFGTDTRLGVTPSHNFTANQQKFSLTLSGDEAKYVIGQRNALDLQGTFTNKFIYGEWNYIFSNSTFPSGTGTIYGSYNSVDIGGNFAEVNGLYGSAFMGSSGANGVALVRGVYGIAGMGYNGAMGTAIGGDFWVQGAASTSTTTLGIALRARARTNAGMTVTELRFLDLSGTQNLGGSVTTSYGIYADTSIDIGTNRFFIHSTSTSPSKIAGDLSFSDTTKGIILKSPDGTCYRFTVANGGALSAGASVTCP